jgi:hypothetical protein
VTALRRRRVGLAAVAFLLVGCIADPSSQPASPAPSSPVPSVASSSATASVTGSAAPPSASPAATPGPSLALDPPATTDERAVAVTVTPELPADGGGRLIVTVESRTDSRIDELVLRWPTALRETILLAPFAPSDDRIRDGGPPLVQPWTKWVLGPGEEGEPDGTTSVGWGPLLPGATLQIPLVATRIAPGPTAFDLQILSRNDLLTDAEGAPAEVRVELP